MISLSPRDWLYLAGAGLIVAALTFGGCEHQNAKAARVDRDRWKQDAESATRANASNQQTIEDLQAAVEKWKGLATPADPGLAVKAEQYRRDLEATRADLDRLARSTDHANPNCRELLATDFGSACHAIGQRLRERAEGRHRNPDR